MTDMFGELTYIPSDTLIDMLFVIVAGTVVLSTNDIAEVEQIQRELQRRSGDLSGSRWVN